MKLNEGKAITFGDLDFAKKTDTRDMMHGRGTGHFGTGFYFVSKDGPYGIDENGKLKYDYNPSRPVYEIDLDNYKLYRPRNNEVAYKLHDAFKVINSYNNSLKPWLNKKINTNKLKDELYQIGWDADLSESMENNLDEIDDIMDSSVLDYYDDAELLTDEQKDKLYEENYKELAKEFIDKYKLESFINIDYTDLESWINSSTPGRIENELEKAIDRLDKDISYIRNAVDTAANILSIDKNKLLQFLDMAYNFKSNETISTLIMKALGYEGIDVTHLNKDAQGLMGLDNFSYGTVIYDLKPGTFRRIMEPRDSKQEGLVKLEEDTGSDTFIFKGKKAWSGAVNTLDGTIEEIHTYKQAKNADFHHSFYFSDEQLDKMSEGESCFFCVSANHTIMIDTTNRFNSRGDEIELREDYLKDRIKEQIKFINEESLVEDLSKEQEEYFKNSKIRDKNGNLLVCYHGTQTPGFNEFNHDNENSRFGNYKFGKYNVNFFATNKDVARGYTDIGVERDGNIYYCYLNIENPYVVNNETEEDVENFIFKRWNNIKDKTIRNRQIEKFEQFWSKWGNKSLGKGDVKYVNKDLAVFNVALIPSSERDEYGTAPYSKDEEYYDLITLGENTGRHPLMYSYGLDEIFDYDNYEEIRDHLVGDIDFEPNNYYLTTNDIIRFVLNMNEEEGTNYDGIIIPDIYDNGPTGSLFGEPTTDIITLKSSNQIKRIDNLKPTSSNRIDEDKRQENILDALDKEFGQEDLYMWSTYILPNGHFLNPDNSEIFKDEEPQYEHCDFEDWAAEQGYKWNEIQDIFSKCCKMNVTVPYISLPDRDKWTNGQQIAIRKILNFGFNDSLTEYDLRDFMELDQAQKLINNSVGVLLAIYGPFGVKVYDLGVSSADDIIKDINRAYTRGMFDESLNEKIVKKGNKWQVQSEDGTKNLGTYDTKKEAEKRLRQVHYFKHMNEDLQETDNKGNVLSKEQIEFFRDSKVRDEQGRLLVCYHGTWTAVKFDVFELGRYANKEEFVWFTTDKEYTKYYNFDNEGYTFECYLNITNPYTILDSSAHIFIDGKYSKELFKIASDFNIDYKLLVNFAREEGINDGTYNNDNNDSDLLIWQAIRSSGFREILKKAGYDGIHCLKENEYETFACMYQNQIKAIDNKTPTNSININESNSKVLRFNQNEVNKLMNSLKDTYKNIKLKVLPIDKLVKDNNLLNDDDLESYHRAIWNNKNAKDFHIDNTQIQDTRAFQIPFVIQRKDGTLKLSDGRHRTRAAYNDGYEYVEYPVYIEENLEKDSQKTEANLVEMKGKSTIDSYKYILKCKHCGSEFKYTRMTNFVKDVLSNDGHAKHYWCCCKDGTKGQDFEIVKGN